MNTTKFSNILLDKFPKKINNSTEDILDVLFTLNEVVREINSIDFCNPLGYILTKALPPDGYIDKLLKGYGNSVTKFVNKSLNKLELNSSSITTDDIEELRLSLEDLIIPEELKDIIPGGDGLTKLLQDVNDSLVITNTVLSLIDKKTIIKSLSNRLTPFMNPSNLAEVLIGNKAQDLNKLINGFIKPERFRADLLKLIKLVNRIDKSIKQIQNIVILVNKIIKTINVLIKIYKISSKIIKKLPIPAKYVTSGVIVTASSKVSKFDNDVNDLEKLLNSVSIFISTSVIKQITRIRIEIFSLLIGLNQLYENLNSCSYFTNDSLLNNIKDQIDNLNDDILLLEDLFPTIKNDFNKTNSLYKGYNLLIINEETTDNNTRLFRKRIVVFNLNGIIEYEGTPTYASDDQILIKEGQYYIDTKTQVGTADGGNDNITDEQTSIILNQIGVDTPSLLEASNKENEVNKILYNQIQNNPEDKKLYDSVIGEDDTNKKIEQIRKIINNIIIQYGSSILLLQNRLVKLSQSLLSKGYKEEEIKSAFESLNSEKYNIKIVNNSITISKN